MMTSIWKTGEYNRVRSFQSFVDLKMKLDESSVGISRDLTLGMGFSLVPIMDRVSVLILVKMFSNSLLQSSLSYSSNYLDASVQLQVIRYTVVS